MCDPGENHKVIKTLTQRLKDVRHIKLKKDLALTKYNTLAGEDWRNSNFLYVISSLHTTLYEIKEFSDPCVSVIQKVLVLYPAHSAHNRSPML